MADFTCCGHDFRTPDAFRDHRKQVHGESGRSAAAAPPSLAADRDALPRGRASIGVIYGDRCKVCRTPIRGPAALPNRLRGIRPFHKNPQLCDQCGRAGFPAVEQEVSVLFADVRGYTAVSETTALPALRRLLNEFFSAAVPILIARDALVDKFMGDAVMALFNAPIPQPRHREAALDAAAALLEAVHRRRWPLAIGVGVNTGMALTGNVGGGDVLDYTAIGDTVNVASRLSGLAGRGEMLAAASTWQGRGARLLEVAASAAVLAVKGRAEPVVAYRSVWPARG